MSKRRSDVAKDGGRGSLVVWLDTYLDGGEGCAGEDVEVVAHELCADQGPGAVPKHAPAQ